MSLPRVAIIGRPNVGKSTLFNRLIHKKSSIIDSKPGVTRDRLWGKVNWEGVNFELLDTGGLLPLSKEKLIQKVRKQVEASIKEADVIFFVVDGKEGLHYLDEEISGLLRKTTKPVILIVNKIDNRKAEGGSLEFYRLGFPQVIPISAIHGLNTNELMERTISIIPKREEKEGVLPFRIMVMGHPNVGKSTLINKILKEERVIVDEEPGTTRDIVEIPFSYEEDHFILIDTAGIRREGKIKEGLEKVSVKKTKRAISKTDLVLFLLDAPRGVIREDLSLGSFLEESGKPLIVLLNKCDLLKEKEKTPSLQLAKKSLSFLYFAPFIFTSGLTGENFDRIFKKAKEIILSSRQRLKKDELEKTLDEIKSRRGPRKDVKIYSLTQHSSLPHVFIIHTNNLKGIGESYQRFIRNYLYQRFGFEGIPLKIKLQGDSFLR